MIMQAATQFFVNSSQESRRKKELKTVLALQLEFLEKQKHNSENNLKTHAELFLCTFRELQVLQEIRLLQEELSCT